MRRELTAKEHFREECSVRCLASGTKSAFLAKHAVKNKTAETSQHLLYLAPAYSDPVSITVPRLIVWNSCRFGLSSNLLDLSGQIFSKECDKVLPRAAPLYCGT
jgi:hypothetical protein